MNLRNEDKLPFWPFALQTLCYFYSYGIFNFWADTQSFVIYFAPRLETLKRVATMTLSDATCFCSRLGYLLPAYSTAFSMILLAYQRYVLVTKPFDAKLILTKKYYKVTGILSFVTTIALSLISATVTIVRRHIDKTEISVYCSAAFFGNHRIRAIIEELVLFVIPAIVCICFYIPTGLKMWKLQTQTKRNRQLTILFSVSCALWIALGIPKALFQASNDMRDVKNANQVAPLFATRGIL